MKVSLVRCILSILFLIIGLENLHAQSPGNVGTSNLTAWFNPDNLPVGSATSWPTTYPSAGSTITLTDAVSPYPTVTNSPGDNVANYNKTISFIGNSISAPMSLELPGTLNLLDNRLSSSQGTLFAVYYMKFASVAQHVVDYRESNNDAIQLRWLSASTSRLAIGTSNATSCVRDYSEGDRPMLISYSGNRINMKCRKKSLEWTNNPTSSSASTGGQIGLTVGARKNSAGVYSGICESYISELIFLNTDLGFIDNLKIESYLAVKYGISLDPNGLSAGKYLASDASEIWNSTSNYSYHNDIIGIGRDDNTALYQKQSHTFDDSAKIYLSSLAANNLSNTSTFTNNVSYLIMGRNQGAANETASATAEMPSGLNLVSRIEREWRITNTNQPNNFNLDITLNSFVNFTSSPANLCLLVDDDGDFSNACVYQSGLSFTVNGNVVTIDGISNTHIPLNSTKYITLSNVSVMPLPTGGLTIATTTTLCAGSSTTLSLSGASSLCGQTYQWASSTDNINFVLIPGASSTNFSISPVSNTYYHCLVTYNSNVSTSSNLLITVNPLPTVSASASPSATACPGNAVTLQGNGGVTYTWNSTPTTGSDSILSPAIAGTYTVVGTDANGCSNSSSIIITVLPSCGSTLHLKLYIQGYYLGAGLMTPTLLNQGVPGATSNQTDSILVELRESTGLYSLVSSVTTILNTDGTATCSFPVSGNYYVVVRHRNGLQTWSANPINIGLSPSTYDFSSSATNAYGSNQTDMGGGVYAFYSGDINNDENIDLQDYSIFDIDLNNFAFGYYPTDINGDGNIDLSDSPILELNILSFIFSNHP